MKWSKFLGAVLRNRLKPVPPKPEIWIRVTMQPSGAVLINVPASHMAKLNALEFGLETMLAVGYYKIEAYYK